MKYFVLAALLLVSYVGAQTTPVPILKQINRVNDDGSYTYGFEAADGTFKVETRDNLGNVKGKYGYIDETGHLKVINYVAGVGFEAAGDHIPKPDVPVQAVPSRPATAPVTTRPVAAARPARPRPAVTPAPVPVVPARTPAPVPVAPIRTPAPMPLPAPVRPKLQPIDSLTSFLPTPTISLPSGNQFSQPAPPAHHRVHVPAAAPVVPQQQPQFHHDVQTNQIRDARRGFSFSFEAPVFIPQTTPQPFHTHF